MSTENRKTMMKIENFALVNNITDYGVLSLICAKKSDKWYDVFVKNSNHFYAFLSSLRIMDMQKVEKTLEKIEKQKI